MSLESCHIRKATVADLDALVDLHYRVFDEHTHYGVLFGRRFIRATYRWYCRAPMAFALVGEIDGEIKGSCTVNRGSYYAVFRANAVELALAFLVKPRLLLVKPVRRRLATLLKGFCARKHTVEPDATRAYLACLAVDAPARGSGMGNELIKRAIEECEKRGWGGIATAVRHSNVPARFMYKTLGFEDAPDVSHDDLVGVAFNGRLTEERQSQERRVVVSALADWLRRQGYRIVSTDSSQWYEVGPRVYQAIPYHSVIIPSRDELRGLLRRQQAIALRYSTPLDEPEGRLSYHVVNTDKAYDLAQLPKKARYDVRKGLEYATVEPISFSRLASEGWSVRLDTLKRQGRVGAETRTWWERLCTSADGLPGFETWGAIHEGRLVAALLACTTDDCCSVLYQQSMTDALQYGVNNALTYCFTKEAITRPDVTMVFYGLDSLDADESVDKFKFRMNYIAQPVRQRVMFHPQVQWLFNGMSHAMLKAAKRRWPGQSTIAKAEGMIRFYLEGKKPLADQTWPDCLTEQKAELLHCR